MNQRQSWKWDAEAAFKSLNETPMGEQYERDEIMTTPYAPPSNIGPERLAQLRKYEPPAKHGRDIEALMRYHEAHKKPVGYWEDAPRGMKFGESANGRPADFESASEGSSPSSPTTTPPADGPWPKWVKWLSGSLTRFDSNTSGKTWYASGGCYHFSAGDYASSGERDGMDLTQSEALQWLEQNGHADVAAELRGKGATKPRDDVATGARV